MAVVVPIISSFDSRGIDRAVRQFSKLEKTSDKAAFGLRAMDQAATRLAVGFAKIATVGVAVGAVVGKQLVDAASSLAESQSKVNVVFGDSAKAVTDFANTAAEKMGMSKQAALEAAGTFGNLIQAFGLGQGQAKEMSTTLVQLASDLASFNNTSTEDAIQALRSGLSGETEPLKKYGVALNDVRLKQVAMNMGLYDGKGALDITAKTQAAYALILQDTALAQGDYARTADGVANRQRTLQAAFQDVKAEIGTALIPVYQSLLAFLQERVIPVFQEFGRILGEQGMGAAFKYLAGQVLGGIANLGTFGNVVYAVIAGLVTLRAATIAQTIATGIFTNVTLAAKEGLLGAAAAQRVLNVTMKANVFGLIVAAVVALVSAIVFLIVKFGLLQKAFGAIKAIGGAIAGFFQRNKELHLQNARAAEVHSAALRNLENRYKGVSKSAAATNEKSYKFFRDSETGALAMRQAAGSAGDFDSAVGGAGKTVETAAEKLKKYMDAARGLTNAQRSARDAAENFKKAQDEQKSIAEKLVAAQDKLRRVSQGYGADSAEAQDKQKALDKAQRAVERSGYDVENAIFAVKDAEKELADLRKDPTTSAQAIREAELKLAEAKLRVADANDAQAEAVKAVTEAQRDLNETVNGASEESETYKDALAEVNALLKDQEANERALIKAQEDVRDATLELIEAQKELNNVRKETPAAIITQAENLLTVGGTGTNGAGGTGLTVRSGGGAAIPASLFGGGSAIRDRMLDLIPFAKGGIVTAPTVGLVGEAGSEAIIPLDRLGSGMTVNVTINAGMGVDPAVVGDEIVNVLQRYNRRNGALPLKVA